MSWEHGQCISCSAATFCTTPLCHQEQETSRTLEMNLNCKTGSITSETKRRTKKFKNQTISPSPEFQYMNFCESKFEFNSQRLKELEGIEEHYLMSVWPLNFLNICVWTASIFKNNGKCPEKDYSCLSRWSQYYEYVSNERLKLMLLRIVSNPDRILQQKKKHRSPS